MEAKRIRINPDNVNISELQQVVDVLERGGVIIYPTDTIYGLGCDITKKRAVERIAKIKGVDAQKAKFSMVFYDLSHIAAYTKPIENSMFRLIKKALPGPYTFILEANSNVPKIFGQSSKKEVGIRVPDHDIPREIVRALGNPIVTTSVLDEDEILEYTTDPDDLYEQYKNVVDLIIDAGFGNNIPSSILDCTGGSCVVIREGMGSVEEFV